MSLQQRRALFLEQRKDQRRTRRKDLAQQAQPHARPYCGRSPRSLQELTASLPFVLLGETVVLRDEAEVRSMEVYEQAGKLPKLTGGPGLCKTRTRVASACSCGNGDCGVIVWQFVQSTDRWTCTRFSAFQCSGLTAPSQQLGSTAYSANMLCVAVKSFLEVDPKAKRAAVSEGRSMLSNANGWSFSFCVARYVDHHSPLLAPFSPNV